ncbi:MAG: hypothetical protein CSB55_04905 [Candidatus Cloacimonadota bacterium]|nr:MAG: hypothetical protein CSB55_04905 [Candidatus Cloacimonadota bacterium]
MRNMFWIILIIFLALVIFFRIGSFLFGLFLVIISYLIKFWYITVPIIFLYHYLSKKESRNKPQHHGKRQQRNGKIILDLDESDYEVLDDEEEEKS